MLDVLRDPIWQFIGATIGVLSVGLAALQLRQRTKRSLTYDFIYIATVGGIPGEERLRLYWDDKPVSQVKVILLEIKNTGNSPIEPKDFIHPLFVAVKGGGAILSADLIESQPDFLGQSLASLTCEEKRVEFPPVLLNAGDYFVVRLLLSDFSGQAIVEGRVVGVKTIAPREVPTQAKTLWWATIGWVAVLALSLLTVYFNARVLKGDVNAAELAEALTTGSTWAAASLVVFFIASLFRRSLRRRSRQ